MTYSIKEAYYTLQGEGANTGKAAIFCRFSGCNLWNGNENDRTNSICSFCDTDFVGINGPNGGKFSTPEDLVIHLSNLWPGKNEGKFVVCTGGEPLLQVDKLLIKAFHDYGFQVAIETNGTLIPPEGIDWICVSPKIGSELKLIKGNELKLVYPQLNGDPEQFENLSFENFYLQPMDGLEKDINIKKTLEYCLKNPKWKLSLQIHKILNIA